MVGGVEHSHFRCGCSAHFLFNFPPCIVNAAFVALKLIAFTFIALGYCTLSSSHFAIVGYLRFQVPDYLFQVGDLRVLWPARGYERLLATLLNGP